MSDSQTWMAARSCAAAQHSDGPTATAPQKSSTQICPCNIWRTLALFFLLIQLQFSSSPAFASQISEHVKSNYSYGVFRKCCSQGQSLAWSMDSIQVGKPVANGSENYCKIDMRSSRTAFEDSHLSEINTSAETVRWCGRVTELCCLSARRLRACRLGSNYVMKYGGQNCSTQNWKSTVEPSLSSVSTECCLCRLFRSVNMTDAHKNVLGNFKESVCPGIDCCQMLSDTENMEGGDEFARKRDIRMENDEPTETQTTTMSSSFYMDEPNEFEMSFGGGVGNNRPDEERTMTSNAISTANFGDFISTTNVPTITCQKNFVWDEKQGLCVRLLTSCPIGMYLNRTLNRCAFGSSELKQCGVGYRFNDVHGSCEDINECLEGLPSGEPVCRGQDMHCVNQPGSHSCVCNSGFMMADDGTCVDINECNQPQNPCRAGQQCVNIIGSFQCVRQVPCGYGYVLNPKTQHCEDVNECKVDPSICGPGMMCVNVRGGHKCVDMQCPGKARRDKFGNCVPCPTGFVFNTTTRSCEDLNECMDGAQCKPWERCVNRQGYFVCEQKLSCEHGFRINNDGTACEDINECQEKIFNCANNEICANTNGSYSCVSSPCHSTQIYEYQSKSCICEGGMKNDNGMCVDINECEELPDVCPSDKACLNEVGGYRCVKVNECHPGFERSGKLDPCVDIDECKVGTARCGENMYCVNTVGSYQCLCKRGYKNLDAHTCIDVDECALFGSNSICPDPRARCVNTNGSHICVCPEGYQWIDYPTPKCTDIDECAQQPNKCGKEHQCVNLEGTYKCVCAAGYRNGPDQKNCLDIDECELHLYHPEKEKLCAHSMCANTPGSYKCRCPDGFRLGRGGLCYDIDECNEIADVCQPKNTYGLSQACVNLMGGYRCVSNQCPPFYNKSRLGNGFRCELQSSYSCKTGDTVCHTERPQRMDYLYIELEQETTVPQILARVDTRHLPSGIIRADLRQDYANHLRTRNAIKAGKAFHLQRSRTQFGSVEVVLTRPLPAPVDILISLHLLSFKENSQTGHSITKLYLFVTQSASERIRLSKMPQYQHSDFWTQLRYSKRHAKQSTDFPHRYPQ